MLKGRAYCFFQSPCTTERIEKALAGMKAAPDLNLPKRLDLSVDCISAAHSALWQMGAGADGTISGAATLWTGKGANYVTAAALPGASNHETANVLGDVFNILYSCSPVLGDAAKPIAEIVFRNDNGVYVSKLRMDMIGELATALARVVQKKS